MKTKIIDQICLWANIIRNCQFDIRIQLGHNRQISSDRKFFCISVFKKKERLSDVKREQRESPNQPPI